MPQMKGATWFPSCFCYCCCLHYMLGITWKLQGQQDIASLLLLIVSCWNYTCVLVLFDVEREHFLVIGSERRSEHLPAVLCFLTPEDWK